MGIKKLTPEEAFWLHQYKKLIGGTITDIAVIDNGEEQDEFEDTFFALLITRPDGAKFIATISADEEYNSAGRLMIQADRDRN